jgi:carbonic anhydrase
VSLTESQLIAFVDELAARRAAWEGLVRHECGARTYEQIWDAPEANAWLICWSLDTDTGWHDHDDAAAGIAVVGGTVREERLCPDLVADDERYAAGFNRADLPRPPARKVAVVACTDGRLNVYEILGLHLGEAHLIRTAGGVVTGAVIRALTISQRRLGTTEIILIHHTDCGTLTFSDDAFTRSIEEETGIKPEWSSEAFVDLEGDVQESIARIKDSPSIPRRDAVRGFVYEMETGRLREVH